MKLPVSARECPEVTADEGRFSYEEVNGRQPEHYFHTLGWIETMRTSRYIPGTQKGSLYDVSLPVEAIEFEGDHVQWIQVRGDDIASCVGERPEADWWQGWTDAQRDGTGQLPEGAGRVWIQASWGRLSNASDGSISEHSLIR